MSEINYENEELFGGDDFVFTKLNDPETGKSTFIGGGYKVNSFFLQGGFPIMTTLNTSEQTGGKVSSPFENLAVPAGLFFINQRIPKNELDIEKQIYHYEQHDVVSDDMIDKLFNLVDANKKQQRKTKKNIKNIKKINSNNKKTQRRT
jgi:hypothetical protein